MWAHIDAAHKTRLEAEYQTNKVVAAKERSDYESQFGKIERKKKKKRIEKARRDE
jgi:hypothetical protein